MERDELDAVVEHANAYLDALSERRVGWTATVDELRQRLGGPLPEQPSPPADVTRSLIEAAAGGIVGTTSPRYFGFVIGGNTPSSLAADWLTSLWDQNAGLYVGGPSASVAEEIAAAWIIEMLNLPTSVSFGLVTGGQMANYTGLAAARHHVLAASGWDVEKEGLQGAPTVRVIAGRERHSTIDRALRFLGLGTDRTELVASDEQGRMDTNAFKDVIGDRSEPTIVCAQAGNVNSGAFDDIGAISDIAHERGAWVHVDGAFGLWAAISERHAHLLNGFERADSWATDAHKWLNVPYDSGLIFCAHPSSHRAAMGTRASYLIHSEGDLERDEMDWNPEFSRRARGFSLYAAIRGLGRSGVTEIIERSCANAQRFAASLSAADGVEVVNDVVLNQVLVRFLDPNGEHDSRTAAVVKSVQRDGTCWLSGSVWQGKGVMRISVSNWATSEADVDRSVEAILRVAQGV